jgi:hypothetical protein
VCWSLTAAAARLQAYLASLEYPGYPVRKETILELQREQGPELNLWVLVQIPGWA